MYQHSTRQFYVLILLLTATGLVAQDTLTFGGVYDLPGAEVRATYTPVSRLASQFTIEEVYRLPGTFYDPARLVALLPGVVQTNDQANHLSVRGNTPNANLWRLNGLAIVNPNHTANAGTFYDFPTLSGGGVNAISAQMLDNSGFFSGGLPVEYGYATGGTFDLRLRPGSKTRRKYQAQAGFIGFDLMAEGPIGKPGQTSYLVNGRYSFTGVLADMGVDFGGEEIRFADFNMHLHHQWDGGELSAFAIVGGSSNVFRFSGEEEVAEQKELTDVDFESGLQIYGLSAINKVGKGLLKSGVSFSQALTDRQQGLTDQPTFIGQEVYDAQLTGNLSYARPVGEGEVSVGVEAMLRAGDLDTRVAREGGGQLQLIGVTRTLAVSPFLNYHRKGQRSDLNVGIRASAYDDSVNDFTFEPRINYELRSGAGRFLVSAERISQLPLAALMLEAGRVNDFAPVSNNITFGYGRTFGGITTMLKGYFQYTSKDYGINEGGFINSANNFLELSPFVTPLTTAATRRYGLELEAAGGRKTKGWYYRGSISLLRAETEQENGDWTKDRFSVDYIGKLTIGREWSGQDRKERIRTYGLNLALIANGGERSGIVTAPDEGAWIVRRFFQPQDLGQGYINQISGYFRPDLRLYKTKVRAKTTTTLALDVQNVAGIQNTANIYYDTFLEQPTERFQLGLIPVLSYRIVWR